MRRAEGRDIDEETHTQDEDEATARYWAEEAGYAAIASLLRQYGATE